MKRLTKNNNIREITESEFIDRLYNSVYDGLELSNIRYKQAVSEADGSLHNFLNALDNIKKDNLFVESLNEAEGTGKKIFKTLGNILKGIAFGFIGLTGFLIYKAIHAGDSKRVEKLLNNMIASSIFGRGLVNTADGKPVEGKVRDGNNFNTVFKVITSPKISDKTREQVTDSYAGVMLTAIEDLKTSITRIHEAMYGQYNYGLLGDLVPQGYKPAQSGHGLIDYREEEGRNIALCTYFDDLVDRIPETGATKLETGPGAFQIIFNVVMDNFEKNDVIRRYGDLLLNINPEIFGNNVTLEGIKSGQLEEYTDGILNLSGKTPYIPNIPVSNLEVFMKIYINYLSYYTDVNVTDSIEKTLKTRNTAAYRKILELIGDPQHSNESVNEHYIVEAEKDDKEEIRKATTELAAAFNKIRSDDKIEGVLPLLSMITGNKGSEEDEGIVYANIFGQYIQSILKEASNRSSNAHDFVYYLTCFFGMFEMIDKEVAENIDIFYDLNNETVPDSIENWLKEWQKMNAAYKENSRDHEKAGHTVKFIEKITRIVKDGYYNKNDRNTEEFEVFLKAVNNYIKAIAGSSFDDKDFGNVQDRINTRTDRRGEGYPGVDPGVDRIDQNSFYDRSDMDMLSDIARGNDIMRTGLSQELVKRFQSIKIANKEAIRSAIDAFKDSNQTSRNILFTGLRRLTKKGEMSDIKSDAKTMKVIAEMNRKQSTFENAFDNAMRTYIETFYQSDIYYKATDYISRYIRPVVKIMLALPDENITRTIELTRGADIADVAKVYPVPSILLDDDIDSERIDNTPLLDLADASVTAKSEKAKGLISSFFDNLFKKRNGKKLSQEEEEELADNISDVQNDVEEEEQRQEEYEEYKSGDSDENPYVDVVDGAGVYYVSAANTYLGNNDDYYYLFEYIESEDEYNKSDSDRQSYFVYKVETKDGRQGTLIPLPDNMLAYQDIKHEISYLFRGADVETRKGKALVDIYVESAGGIEVVKNGVVKLTDRGWLVTKKPVVKLSDVVYNGDEEDDEETEAIEVPEAVSTAKPIDNKPDAVRRDDYDFVKNKFDLFKSKQIAEMPKYALGPVYINDGDAKGIYFTHVYTRSEVDDDNALKQEAIYQFWRIKDGWAMSISDDVWKNRNTVKENIAGLKAVYDIVFDDGVTVDNFESVAKYDDILLTLDNNGLKVYQKGKIVLSKKEDKEDKESKESNNAGGLTLPPLDGVEKTDTDRITI